jgi:tripartite-type tricarboxylate transporter receptor subunit TctC
MVQYVRSGALRPLAVTTTVRSDILPNVPTVAESVPGYEASDLYGIAAPKGTPPAVVDRLNKEVNAWLNDEAVKKKLADLGGMTTGGTSVYAGELIASETEKWAKVVKFSGAKAE